MLGLRPPSVAFYIPLPSEESNVLFSAVQDEISARMNCGLYTSLFSLRNVENFGRDSD